MNTDKECPHHNNRGARNQYGFSIHEEEPQSIFTMPKGKLFILIGSLCPKAPKPRFVHQVPQVERVTEILFLPILDPVINFGSEPNTLN